MIKIKKIRDETKLIISFVNEQTTLTEPFRVRIGLQATPVKPMPPDHRLWNITWNTNNSDREIDGEICIDWPQSSRTKWYGIPNPTYPVTYRSTIDRIHNNDVRFIPYGLFSHLDTPLIQEYSQYMERTGRFFPRLRRKEK